MTASDGSRLCDVLNVFSRTAPHLTFAPAVVQLKQVGLKTHASSEAPKKLDEGCMQAGANLTCWAGAACVLTCMAKQIYIYIYIHTCIYLFI